jgi:hypothetical protein
MQDTPEKPPERSRKPRRQAGSEDATASESDELAGEAAEEQETEETSTPATHEPKRAATGDEKARGKKDKTGPEPKLEDEKEKAVAPPVSLSQRMRFQIGGRRPRR